MSWWSKIFGAGEIVGAVKETVDDLHYSGEEKARDDQAEGIEVRKFAAPGTGGNGAINDLVDSYNRLIRPGVTTWLIGGLSGWWDLPDISKADPFWSNIFLIVVTFWFGGRALLKDLPKAIRSILQIRALIK